MFQFDKSYDVIVVGGGHAGVEAALAAARIGCETLLLTLNPDGIGQMSCNPAIGGLGKGHIVREIDAMGGEMGINTDMTGIHFRLLNTKKGPSVQSPRAQCDKKLYQARLKWVCERQANLDVKLGQVSNILVSSGVAVGVETTIGIRFHSQTIVVTTGTFLQGLMHVGEHRSSGGRAGDSNSSFLSASLLNLGLKLGRLKTGTPPRVSRRSLDFGKMEVQRGDDPPSFFSHRTYNLFHVEHEPSTGQSYQCRLKLPAGSAVKANKGQVDCFITHTTAKTGEIVRSNLAKSPMYAGIIRGIGPRYCPSIEDKIVRFESKEQHLVFMEPEGLTTDEIYINGVSTSLPYDVQVQLVRSIKGCDRAELIRPAYAVEYDFAFPTQLTPALEVRCCKNLFLAGQINGTSGYEEAAAQGLIAGINAALTVARKPHLILRRDQAYIGVLIDDLVTKGTTEPYRMFTSRAEHRLMLRQDNADQRLSQIGYGLGLLPGGDYLRFMIKRDAIASELHRLQETKHGDLTLDRMLRRPEMSYDKLPCRDETLPEEVTRQVETIVKYEGYVLRQQKHASRLKALDTKTLDNIVDYSLVPNLRMEARQKLNEIRPKNVGQASRISGVSPADVSALAMWLCQSAKLRETHAKSVDAGLNVGEGRGDALQEIGRTSNDTDDNAGEGG